MDEMADVAQLLAADRRTTVERLAALRQGFAVVIDASEGSNADDEHDPEGSTIAYERSQLAALIEQSERHLVEIDAALARVADGTHGICAVCGQPIPQGRLEARPTATTCVRHATTRR
ncbi:MAG: TraR/DksA C4-type zinc finger protein [Terracoccus sp.]